MQKLFYCFRDTQIFQILYGVAVNPQLFHYCHKTVWLVIIWYQFIYQNHFYAHRTMSSTVTQKYGKKCECINKILLTFLMYNSECKCIHTHITSQRHHGNRSHALCCHGDHINTCANITSNVMSAFGKINHEMWLWLCSIYWRSKSWFWRVSFKLESQTETYTKMHIKHISESKFPHYITCIALMCLSRVCFRP